MRWQDKLTKEELRHLREDAEVKTLAEFKKLRVAQKQFIKEATKKYGEANQELCYECRHIAIKLSLE